MHIKLPFESSKPVSGEASVELDKSAATVFSYIGENFFNNYPKWAVEVIDFEALDGKNTFIGAKAKQIRQDNNVPVESVFEIVDYKPNEKIEIQGINDPYKQSYLVEASKAQPTRLTFRFELLELDIFMRPFEKLIRSAIEDGAENTVTNIKNLINAECH